ncbi:hypothetical protein THAOC_25812, partial [Thalassiosira oceanica]
SHGPLGRTSSHIERAASPRAPGPSPSPGGEAIQIRDIRFTATSEAGKSETGRHSGKIARDGITSEQHIGADKSTTDGRRCIDGCLRLTEATDRPNGTVGV